MSKSPTREIGVWFEIVQKQSKNVEFVKVASRSSITERLRNPVTWILFLISAAFLLRPVLLTAIAADDLINPFSQIYHAGNQFGPIFRRTWSAISPTGHFNYAGQLIGSLITACWSFLIGDLAIRFSLVYACTKFIVYMLTIEISSRLLRHTLRACGSTSPIWNLRILMLLTIAVPIQIHIPWSNDPVASYPLSGFLTVAIALTYLLLVHKLLLNPSLGFAVAIGLYGIFAVLYYEFNSFVILASTCLIANWIWSSRKNITELRRNFLYSVTLTMPAFITTLFFYTKNRAGSVNYTGTAISFEAPFPKTFIQGLISALPASGWNVSIDWLATPISYTFSQLSQLIIALSLLFVVLLMRPKKDSMTTPRKIDLKRIAIFFSPFLIYWLGATLAQTSTIKVQQEATRIGQVYNYYAVGAVCAAMFFAAFLITINWKRVQIKVRVFLVILFIPIGAFQYALNWNITSQFNLALSGNRNLLVAFADQPPMEQRCAAFDAWKSMGWPEYYWLDMELGMNASYQLYRGVQFCQK